MILMHSTAAPIVAQLYLSAHSVPSRTSCSWRGADAAGNSYIAGAIFPPCNELLATDIFYARDINRKEESDRRQQSLILCEIAKLCYSDSL
jgi:hypothetical protein